MKWLVELVSIPRTYSRNFLVWWLGLVVLEQLNWLAKLTWKYETRLLPSGLTLALFPLIPPLILKSISGASISSFSDLSFSFMGNINIQIAALIQDMKHEKLNKIPGKNRPLMQNLVFNPGIQMTKCTASLIHIQSMKKRTNSDCRFWVDLRRRWKEVIGQQKGHACKITHPDSVLVGSRVIFSNANILIAMCQL